jgi:predicted  nucleic acid-binding Zn-ribbon protein
MSPTRRIDLITAEWDREELQEIARKLEEAKERFETITLAIEELEREIQELDDNGTQPRDELSGELSDYRGEGDSLWEQISAYERALKPREI